MSEILLKDVALRPHLKDFETKLTGWLLLRAKICRY